MFLAGMGQYNPVTMQNVQMSQSQVGAPRAASPMTHPSQMSMGNVPAVSVIWFYQAAVVALFSVYLLIILCFADGYVSLQDAANARHDGWSR